MNVLIYWRGFKKNQAEASSGMPQPSLRSEAGPERERLNN